MCQTEMKELNKKKVTNKHAVVAFFEEAEEDEGDNQGWGKLSVSSVKRASLRPVRTVEDLKIYRDTHLPTIPDATREGIKYSRCIIDELIRVKDLSKYKEIRKVFLAKDMKKL